MFLQQENREYKLIVFFNENIIRTIFRQWKMFLQKENREYKYFFFLIFANIKLIFKSANASLGWMSNPSMKKVFSLLEGTVCTVQRCL